MALVVRRARRAGEVDDHARAAALRRQRPHDVVAHEAEARMGDQPAQVRRVAGREVVEPEHVGALLDQAFAQVAADESGGAGNEDQG